MRNKWVLPLVVDLGVIAIAVYLLSLLTGGPPKQGDQSDTAEAGLPKAATSLEAKRMRPAKPHGSAREQAELGGKGSAASLPNDPPTGTQAVAGSTEAVLEIGGGVKMEFVLVPAGSFQMGSDSGAPDEKPVHKVTIAKAFYMGKYEVTAEQWKAVMGSFPNVPRGPKYPVDRVSWNTAQDFVGKLSQKTGRPFSLPTEAEWEYACRSGSSTEFSFGDYQAQLRDYAWYGDQSGQGSHPVGGKKPNAWRLYDMHGNLWEWCDDAYHPTYDGAPADGTGWLQGGQGAFRVLRGGSWANSPEGCRSARRYWLLPSDDYTDFGFLGCRVVLRNF